ncbi:MAG: GIY-YIG nuclease family protein [Roseibium sp.]|nr:GIY-YIG nuclease family protein [Roseibium sp.]
MVAYVYMMASAPNGTLYTGVTTDLVRRVHEHRTGALPGFSARYGCKRLVWYEVHERIGTAIQREKNIKYYVRRWKINLIRQMNPGWNDLYPELNG